ncbi:hypothetical protein ACH5RR_008471 [Cinchona calisaya]|uniref:FBD domain-containing protein n=1 Tax=Cinchona calisaya TaxID=153742 RepID=A0ABD3ABU6_9GENT
MLGALPPCVTIHLERIYFSYRFGNSIGDEVDVACSTPRIKNRSHRGHAPNWKNSLILRQLIYLKLESRSSGSTRTLMNLLRKAPNLRYLDIYSNFFWKNDDYEMLGTLPLCVMIRLERIYVTYRFGNSIGFQLMKLILQNAHTLQLMYPRALEVPNYWKMEIKLMLLASPRASRT